VKRSRLAAAVFGLVVLGGVSTWIFTAEARGVPPPGNYAATEFPDWPLPEGNAEAARREAFARAAVTLPDPFLARQRVYGEGGDPLDAALVTCRYLADEPSGTSAKFDCVLDGGEIVKVKYSRNPEIHAEVAATRLLSAMGYAADHVRIVDRLRCYGCPRFPFLTSQLLFLVGAFDLIGDRGFEDAFTDFDMVAVERRFAAPPIKTDDTEGWAWFELAKSKAPRADLDALRLLAVFLGHWDNKSDNQRLVCLDELPSTAAPCAQPLLMIQDLGATFGPVKANLSNWRHKPVWADRAACLVSMKDLPWAGATFQEARISEGGRLLLGEQLSQLSADDIRALFREARFHDFQSTTDDDRDLDAWTAAFQHRVEQIVHGPPCPDVTGHGGPEPRSNN
jgi:hypothetical protein